MAKFKEIEVERQYQVTLTESEIVAILLARAALQNDSDPAAKKNFNTLDSFAQGANNALEADG